MMKTLAKLSICILLFSMGAFVSYLILRFDNVVYNLNISDTRERIVFSETEDDVINGGVLFTKQEVDKENSVAFLWVHGWGVNYYSPTYIGIGREICKNGHTMLSANTRMHDIGNILKYSYGKRVRGGGYWGVASDQVLDIESWVDLLSDLGYKNIVLVGHSAGWSAVKQYQVARKDSRVVGLVLASGTICGNLSSLSPEDSMMLAKAESLVEAGLSEELIPIPNRSLPSYISAGSFLDNQTGESAGIKDFFGTKIDHPELLSVNLPVLLFYGSRDDIAGADELETVKKGTMRFGEKAPEVTTSMIDGTDHMYNGKEEEVARLIVGWAEEIVSSKGPIPQ